MMIDSMLSRMSLRLRLALQKIQSVLAFERWTMYPAYNTNQGLGRAALVSLILGVILGMHTILLLVAIMIRMQSHQDVVNDSSINSVFGPHRIQLWIQWCMYVNCVCTFHLAEFFATSIWNPRVVSSDSFIVNHSYAYTAAAILSVLEFSIRIVFFPRLNSVYVMFAGLAIVIVAQTIRTVAIATCGESFNHLIQTSKKDNHVLITHGIYKYLRHPSYVGFFYWAIGTQLMLCNPVQTVVFTCATWTFFQRRIPYEEECLEQLFPNEYQAYAAKTAVGIPFL